MDYRFCYAVLQWPDYDLAEHIHLLADNLEAVEREDILRLAALMPPRHGKTKLISETFPPWYLGRNPDKNIIVKSKRGTSVIYLHIKYM